MMYRNQMLTRSFLEANGYQGEIPDPDSFFYRAFKANKTVAEQCLTTKFLLGIQCGNLPPDIYGSLTVLDAYYCYQAAGSFCIAASRAQAQKSIELARVLEHLTAKYEKFNKVFLQTWHLEGAASVKPTEAWQAYAAHERAVAEKEEPVYTLVSMLPCYHLWYWIADQLISYADNNLYGEWIKGAHYPDSAYFLGILIQDWQKSGKPFNEAKALEIYKNSMEYEYENFNEADKSAAFIARLYEE